MPTRRDYDVGYGKPPVHSRFKPGVSPNPSGGKKGRRSLKADFEAELLEVVTVTENGKILKLSKQQLVVKALVTKAAKGDTRAIAKLIDVVTLLFGIAPDEEASVAPLSADDAAVMAAAIEQASKRKEGGLRSWGVNRPRWTRFCAPTFGSFLHRVFLTVAPGDDFQDNWHLGAIAHQLERIRTGESNRLIINVPPRSLKSIAVSVAWVAWRLGHDPALCFVCCSYSAELALKHARDCRAVMQSDWYQRAFPRTVLSKERNAEHDFQTTARGGRFSTSVGGIAHRAGRRLHHYRRPALKPADATSEKAPARWRSSGSAARSSPDSTTRRPASITVLVMQRLHEDDLAGHLLEAGGWDLLCLPAIAEVDEGDPSRGRAAPSPPCRRPPPREPRRA